MTSIGTVLEDFHREWVADDDEFWEDLVETVSIKGGIGDSVMDCSDCGFTCPYPELSVNRGSAFKSLDSREAEDFCEFEEFSLPKISLEGLGELSFPEKRKPAVKNHTNKTHIDEFNEL